MKFEHFQIGDVISFEKSFEQEQFEAFALLSGDRNPLHWDHEHAENTRFGRPIVPLHMTLLPISAIAGMTLPGKPSLILGHEVRATLPVYYGDILTYSARIQAINAAKRVLTIRVLALRAAEIVLDLTMRVSATSDEWDNSPKLSILSTQSPARVVVTGASGEIGRETAFALAAKGHKLLLQDRGPDERRKRLSEGLDRIGAEYNFVGADLASPDGQKILAEKIRQCDDIEGLVHTASAGAASSLGELVATNFSALRVMCEAALPKMLLRQKGRVLYISSIMIRGVPNWDEYVGAKTMGTGYVSGLESRFSHFGVRGLSLLPGIVATPFSEAYRGDAPVLLPQEVAAEAVQMFSDPSASCVTIEPGVKQTGRFGLQISQPPSKDSTTEDTPPSRPLAVEILHSGAGKSKRAEIEQFVKSKFRLPSNYNLADAGVGVTPGWDSLSQIELLLALESEFNISFTSVEIESLTQFSKLARIVESKVSRV